MPARPLKGRVMQKINICYFFLLFGVRVSFLWKLATKQTTRCCEFISGFHWGQRRQWGSFRYNVPITVNQGLQHWGQAWKDIQLYMSKSYISFNSPQQKSVGPALSYFSMGPPVETVILPSVKLFIPCQ